MYAYVPCLSSGHTAQSPLNVLFSPLQLEPETLVKHHVGTGNRIWLFRKECF